MAVSVIFWTTPDRALRWSKIAANVQGQYDSSPSRVCRTTPRPMGPIRVLAAPIVATLPHDLGVGAVAPWIIYAIIAVPVIAMLFDRKIDVDPLVRWVLFALIALAAILPTRFS